MVDERKKNNIQKHKTRMYVYMHVEKGTHSQMKKAYKPYIMKVESMGSNMAWIGISMLAIMKILAIQSFTIKYFPNQ